MTPCLNIDTLRDAYPYRYLGKAPFSMSLRNWNCKIPNSLSMPSDVQVPPMPFPGMWISNIESWHQDVRIRLEIHHTGP